MTMNAVCAGCNAGWLNDLEDRATPAIDFFALAAGTLPTRLQLDDFAFWAVTRALLRTHYSPSGHAPESLFHSIYQRRQTRTLPDGFIVSIAPTTPVSMEAGVHQSSRLNGSYLGHVAVSLGVLFISVLLADPDGFSIDLANRASVQQRMWFPGSFWLLAPDFRTPPVPVHVLQQVEALVAGSLLGFLLNLQPADQFGSRIDFAAVVPPARRGRVPWPEAPTRG